MNYETRYAAHPQDFASYDTARIRNDFLIPAPMTEGEIHLVYTHYDRYIAGGAVPTDSPLILKSIDPLKSDYFLERRELGVINVGGKGKVLVDGETFELAYKEALYVGKGKKSVEFHSSNPANPAKFYLNSAPAHATHSTQKIGHDRAELVELGSAEMSNARTIRKLIVNSIVPTCQLQMGMTELKSGSVWNTMPAHVHDRRMEVYYYFEVPKGQSVCHFMGQPDHTRVVWMQNEQAVISPPWSIHCGAGTSSYTFIWGMAGENLDYGDMDGVPPTEMR